MYCKNCGTMVADNDKFCRNCGAPMRYDLGAMKNDKAFWRHGWFTILMLFICFPVGVILIFINHPSIVKTFFMFFIGVIVLSFVAVGFNGCSSNVAETIPQKIEERESASGSENQVRKRTEISDEKHRTSATSKIIKKVVGIPDQVYFGYKLYDFKEAYQNADNKLNKSAVHSRQVKFLKEYFPKNKFENWRGKIKDIGSVENGKFASVNIECKIDGMVFYIATEKYNVQLSGKQTLIKEGSKLYSELLGLKKDDIVEFSAKVIPNKECGLYLDNWVSERLSVESPEFIVQFIDIKKVSE